MPIRVIEPPPTATGRIRIIEPAPASKPRRSMVDNVTGFMANVNRGLGIGDELVAAGKTAGDVVTGRAPISEVGNVFARNMGDQRQIEDGYRAEHPNLAALGQGTGGAVQAALPLGPAANAFAAAPRWINMTRGATTAGVVAAANAFADRGTGAERLNAASDASRNLLILGTGALGGAFAPVKGKAPRAPTQAQQDAATLADIGVTTTIPQRMGRGVKATEDLASRAPIIGIAKAGLQDRQLEQLNRGVALKALQPVGMTIPKEIKPGFEMVQYVDDALSGVYDKAAKLTPRVQVDDALRTDLASIADRRVDLSDDEAALFTRAMDSRLNRLSSGEASGEMVKTIHSELGDLQAEAARKGSSSLSSMFGDSRRALMGVIGRTNPRAGGMIARADKGWQVYSVLNDAAAAASNRGGVFLPGQLNTQSRASAKAIGSNMAGKGRGTLQDIATAASRVLPDSYGNPGTANALALGALGTQALYNPPAAAATATALTAAATPYFLMGRKIIEELPDTASRAQLQAAATALAELSAKDPAVAALRREVAARLSVGAGVAGARASAPTEVTIDRSTAPEHLAWRRQQGR